MITITEYFNTHRGEVTVLAGNPFQNCSYLVLLLAWQKAMRGERVYFYSPQCSALHTMERACVQMTMQDADELREKTPNSFQRAALAMAHKELSRMPIVFDDRETQGDLSLLLQRVERAGQWDLLIVNAPLSQHPHVDVETEMSRLATFAAQSNTAVLLCDSITVADDRKDKHPHLTDLPTAYRAQKNIWLFYQPSYYDEVSIREYMSADVSIYREDAFVECVPLAYYRGIRTFLPGDFNPLKGDPMALVERYGKRLCKCVESYLTEGNSEARAAALSILLVYANGKAGTYGAKRLGDFYELEGEALDAIYLWEIAALHGDVEAMMQLSGAYIAGELVPQDMQKGYFWLQQASIAETEENK